LTPFVKFTEVSLPSVSRKWIIQDFPSSTGSELSSIIFEGHPVIKDPSQLLSPVPDPGRTLVRNGTRHPHPNRVAKPFETSEEVVR